MADPIDKSKLISTSYEESPASFHNEELGMSIAPEDAIVLSDAPQGSPEALDHYQSGLAALSLESLVEVQFAAVRQDEVPSTIQLRALIVEAGRGTGWAVDELENFLTQSLGLKDSSELNVCFDSCEANVADILLQLRQGDAVQRSEAAKSLLGIILGEPRDAGENLADLKRGLLVAAGHIAELSKSDTFYKEVARLDAGKRQELWTMSHDSRLQPDPKLLLTLKESQSKTPEAKKSVEDPNFDTPAPALAGGAVPALAGGNLPGTAASVPASVAATTKALAWTNGGLPLIEQILSESLPRASEQQRFLQGSGLGPRLSEIAQNPQLTPAQISQGLYYAILARGLGHHDFTSATKHYGELRPVAAQIAGTILTRLGLASDAKAHLRGDYTASKISQIHAQNHPELHGEIAAGSDARPGYAATRSYAEIPAARSLGIFTSPEAGSAGFVPGAIATSSAVAAGMMSIPFLSLVAGTQQTQVGGRSDSRPGYFVEGPTTTQGDSHGGTGGQSSRDQGQNQRQAQPDQVVVA